MKTLVENTFNGKTNVIYLPCNDTVAATFCTDMLEGRWVVYEKGTDIGTSDVATEARDTSVMISNSTTHEKAYLNLLVKPTTTEEQVYTALTGLTISGIVVDTAYIVGARKVTF